MKLVKALVACVCAGFMFAAPASATVTLYIVADGGAQLAIADGSAQDTCLSAGCVTFNGNIGGWDVVVSTGLSDSPIPSMDLHSLVHSRGAGNIILAVFDTNFLAGGGPGPLATHLEIGGTQDNGKINLFQTVINTANAQTGIGVACSGPVQCANFGPVSGSPFAASGDNVFTIPGGPFGMGIFINLSHTAGGSTSYDARLTVPEPTTLALLGLALTGLGFVARRKQA
jgi:hypothetical protein